jgi:hypothetical protein
MKRVHKPARSIETALEIVDTGIKKIVAGLRVSAPEPKPTRTRIRRARATANHT